MGRYNPFLSDLVSFKVSQAKVTIKSSIASAATAIEVKSVRLMSLVAMDEKIRQGAVIYTIRLIKR